MTVLYADTSAIVRAYFSDEPDHAQLRALLLEGEDPVVTSELARVEFAAAVTAAARARRLRKPKALLDRFDADTSEDGSISLLRLSGSVVFDRARGLAIQEKLRTLDAIHLAVALDELPALGGTDVAIATRDARQGVAAKRNGLAVR